MCWLPNDEPAQHEPEHDHGLAVTLGGVALGFVAALGAVQFVKSLLFGITTHDPVTLLMSGRQLHAQGLVASLKERHVQLESAVHGSFQP